MECEVIGDKIVVFHDHLADIWQGMAFTQSKHGQGTISCTVFVVEDVGIECGKMIGKTNRRIVYRVLPATTVEIMAIEDSEPTPEGWTEYSLDEFFSALMNGVPKYITKGIVPADFEVPFNIWKNRTPHGWPMTA